MTENIVVGNIAAGTIVVGYDGSDSAAEAVTWAAHEAIARKVPLRLLACFELPVGVADATLGWGVALAALSARGEAGRGKALMSDPRSAACLRIAKLNLYQCLASAGPHYEDIYCLGQHAMIDPGQCVVDAAAPKRSPVQKASYKR